MQNKKDKSKWFACYILLTAGITLVIDSLAALTQFKLAKYIPEHLKKRLPDLRKMLNEFQKGMIHMVEKNKRNQDAESKDAIAQIQEIDQPLHDAINRIVNADDKRKTLSDFLALLHDFARDNIGDAGVVAAEFELLSGNLDSFYAATKTGQLPAELQPLIEEINKSIKIIKPVFEDGE